MQTRTGKPQLKRFSRASEKGARKIHPNGVDPDRHLRHGHGTQRSTDSHQPQRGWPTLIIISQQRLFRHPTTIGRSPRARARDASKSSRMDLEDTTWSCAKLSWAEGCREDLVYEYRSDLPELAACQADVSCISRIHAASKSRGVSGPHEIQGHGCHVDLGDWDPYARSHSENKTGAYGSPAA
jgi:hypothetical protein